jgi:hypothetical protein
MICRDVTFLEASMEQTEQDAGKPKLERSFQHFFCCFLAQVDKSDRMCLQKIASDLNEANIADSDRAHTQAIAS